MNIELYGDKELVDQPLAIQYVKQFAVIKNMH